jgi:hypothetical protein
MLAPVIRTGTTAAALAVALTLTIVSSATAAQQVDVPQALGSVLSGTRSSRIPVLLPGTAKLDVKSSQRLYPLVLVTPTAYSLTLSPVKDCTADACFLADFSAANGRPLGYTTTNVALANGQRGYFRALSCGASCSPASIQWIEKGVRYEIQANALGGKREFVAMADSAIRAGDRG